MRKFLIMILSFWIFGDVFSQFHLRFTASKNFSKLNTESTQIFELPSLGMIINYNGVPILEPLYQKSSFSQFRSTSLANNFRIGIGLKYNYRKVFFEFAPFVESNTYNGISIDRRDNQFFSDPNFSISFPQSLIDSYNLPRNIIYTEKLPAHKVMSFGLNCNLGVEIAKKHSLKISVTNNWMPLNQFGSDNIWDDSDKLVVSSLSGNYSFEIFMPITAGLIYEYKIFNNFFVSFGGSVQLKAIDQKGEQFYLPVKRSLLSSCSFVYQIPKKNERIKQLKRKVKSSNPQIL